MAKQTLNTGTTANDGTGDTLRSAATKINQNFTELYAADVASDARVTNVYTTANDANNIAHAAYAYANTIVSDTFIDPFARTTANAGFLQANASNVFAHAAFAYANTIISDIQIDPFARTTANAGFLQANSANNLAQAAFDAANTTGRSITGPDTANVTVNLNGTVSLTADDGDVNIATWTYDAEGNIILPAEAGLVTTDAVTIGYYDINAQSAVGALAAFYSTTANNAVVEITARNDIAHQNKVQIISDGATGEDYVNIELYDGGQLYGTSSWKFHNSGILESAIASAPTTSVGVAGDKRGMIIHTSTHMYFCTDDYDGTTDIWRRMEWNVSDTW